jgi:hypothetical protein
LGGGRLYENFFFGIVKWQKSFSGQDDALITMTGFDHANSNELLQHFSSFFISSQLMLLLDATFSNYRGPTSHKDAFVQLHWP